MADKQLGKRLKALRKARGKKRGEVAKALGINYSTITNHENSGLGIRLAQVIAWGDEKGGHGSRGGPQTF